MHCRTTLTQTAIKTLEFLGYLNTKMLIKIK